MKKYEEKAKVIRQDVSENSLFENGEFFNEVFTASAEIECLKKVILTYRTSSNKRPPFKSKILDRRLPLINAPLRRGVY